MIHRRKQLVVVGHGMVGHRFVQAAIERGVTETYDVVVVGEEPRAAYDRVALTSFFEVGADELSLLRVARTTTRGSGCILGTAGRPARPGREDGAAGGRRRRSHYDELVLATGAAPFVPPVPGRDLPGCFVYRTIEDLEAIRDAAGSAKVGAVIGGGLLGLEAANALVQLGLETHVVEMAPRLMPVQVDDAGGGMLARHIEKLGLTIHTGAATEEVLGEERVTGLALKDAEPVAADIVVFSAGIRPRDALARGAGLDLAERGGVLVDERCRTSDEHVWAIGECAAPAGTMYGLVAPGYAMAEVVVDALLGGPGAVHRRRHVHQAQAARGRRRQLRRRVRHHRGCAGAGLRRRGGRPLQEARGQRRRQAAARRHPGRRRVGVRHAAADGRRWRQGRHRAARQPRGPDPPGVARRRSRSACPTRRSSAPATT